MVRKERGFEHYICRAHAHANYQLLQLFHRKLVFDRALGKAAGVNFNLLKPLLLMGTTRVLHAQVIAAGGECSNLATAGNGYRPLARCARMDVDKNGVVGSHRDTHPPGDRNK